MLLIDKLTNKVDFSKSEIIIADFIIQLGEKIKNYSARSIAKETYTIIIDLIWQITKLFLVFSGFI